MSASRAIGAVTVVAGLLPIARAVGLVDEPYAHSKLHGLAFAVARKWPGVRSNALELVSA